MSIAVLGGGAFGGALAITLAQDADVTLWMRDGVTAETAASTRHLTRLPGVTLPKRIKITADLDVTRNAQMILLAIPTQQLGGFLADHSTQLATAPLIACCKGIDLSTGAGPVKLIQSYCPDRPVAMLTGPSFAADIARGLPTALTLACGDRAALESLQSALTRANLRLYRSTDTSGAELGGALKNVIAIAAGAAMGAGLGESARAALITRGFAEMQRFATARGARPETLAGLSGFGDLVLTCTSEQSRNYLYGVALGRGTHIDENITVEGRATAQAVAKMADDMPISRAVAALILGDVDVKTAMTTLLTRPLKEE